MVPIAVASFGHALPPEGRDQLSSCIGCGFLSLDRCALYNPDDAAGSLGTGPRYLLGDSPHDLRLQQ